MEIKIGPARYVKQFSGSKRKMVLRTDVFHYIPIEETLKKLLKCPDIVYQIDNFHGSTNDTLMDMCDGSIFKTHAIFKADKRTIQIIAYFDEVEVCNPLGSNAKKHKLGCIFFSIGNLHPKFRSKLKCIFVAAVARSVVIKKHGMNLFLKPFVDSIRSLSTNGLSVCTVNGSRQFKFSTLACLADTLGAHALGGFKESMSFARRICRSCMATTEQIQSDFHESHFELRNAEEHKRQLSALDSSTSVEYGINRSSVLDEIPYFSVAENLPHDVMHDLFEGVLPYEIKLLLAHLVHTTSLTIATLNDRLRRFDFGYSERSDVPTEIDEKTFKSPTQKIRQSASKMWLFAVTLPLIIGDLVSEDCEEWVLYNKLLRICSIVCSWRIKPENIAYLGILIEEHHSKFHSLYPSASMIPKLHYMVHYPSQILEFGPLIYSWTMRHEAKLHIVKRAASHGNFNNISFTVAKRSGHALCYHLNCGSPFLDTSIEMSNTCSLVPFECEPQEIQLFVRDLGLSSVDAISHPTWIKVNCMHIKKYACVYLKEGELYPTYGKIVDIIKVPTLVKFALRIQTLETQYFDAHYSAFVVKLLPSFSVISFASLPLFPVLHVRNSFSTSHTYIIPKQYYIT